MKKSFILSVIALFILTVCIYSCSKSDYLEPTNRKSTSKSQYRPPKVDDMGAYLLDFKQKMQSRGNDETMGLDEAAWHLSSIANYDFGDVVSTYDNFYYDTLYYNINVENGRVSLSDLNSVYTQAANDIPKTVSNLNLENKHIRFIGTDISNDGLVIMSILVSYGWINHQWYFPDPVTLSDSLCQYFGDDFYCNLDDFTDTLETVLNDLVAYHPSLFSGTSLVIANTVVFYFRNHIDPYYYDNVGDSRLLARYYMPSWFYQDDFFYYFDSYAGLGVDSTWCGINKYDIIDFNLSVQDEFNHGQIKYHQLTVRYGFIFYPVTPPSPQD